MEFHRSLLCTCTILKKLLLWSFAIPWLACCIRQGFPHFCNLCGNCVYTKHLLNLLWLLELVVLLDDLGGPLCISFLLQKSNCDASRSLNCDASRSISSKQLWQCSSNLAETLLN